MSHTLYILHSLFYRERVTGKKTDSEEEEENKISEEEEEEDMKTAQEEDKKTAENKETAEKEDKERAEKEDKERAEKEVEGERFEDDVRWWSVAPHEKAEQLLVRQATTGDVKLRGAAQRSRYYKKYGNPNLPPLELSDLRYSVCVGQTFAILHIQSMSKPLLHRSM